MLRQWQFWAVWACFLTRGCFYASMLPLWEGYDEWAHFSVIQSIAFRGRILVPRDQPTARDVEESTRLAPVPWEMRNYPPPAVLEEAYWRLPEAERREREARLRAMPTEWRYQDAATLKAYEALQPPLYYWLTAPVLRAAGAASLPAQVIVLRWMSVAIASLTIPLVLLIAREVFADFRVALGCAAIVALMPGFAYDVARVGNDSLAVVLYSALTLAVLKGRSRAAALLLGFGLITKAYFLAAVPVTAVKARWATLAAALIGGWWYVRNLVTTGTLSGLSEAVMVRGGGPFAVLRNVGAVPWRTAVDAILFSHLYFAGWSSLMVRSWMYHVFYVVIAVSAVGLIWQIRRRQVQWLLGFYLAFWAAQLYNVLLLYASKGLPGSMGWYMYAVVAAEVVLCVAGFGRFAGRAAAGGAALFAVFDLYTVHAVAIPYYVGAIGHKASGALEALHPAALRAIGFGGTFERLSVNKGALIGPAMLMGLWALYLAATVLPAVIRGPQTREGYSKHPSG